MRSRISSTLRQPDGSVFERRVAVEPTGVEATTLGMTIVPIGGGGAARGLGSGAAVGEPVPVRGEPHSTRPVGVPDHPEPILVVQTVVMRAWPCVVDGGPELRPAFGIDVFAEPFDHESGFTVYNTTASGGA
jgi:hypothetical protein